MSDLISRGELFNRLASVWTIEDVYAVIQDMPTKEMDIIRCKDCAFYKTDSHGIPYCRIKNYGYGWKPDDFCSSAERRNNDL